MNSPWWREAIPRVHHQNSHNPVRGWPLSVQASRRLWTAVSHHSSLWRTECACQPLSVQAPDREAPYSPLSQHAHPSDPSYPPYPPYPSDPSHPPSPNTPHPPHPPHPSRPLSVPRFASSRLRVRPNSPNKPIPFLTSHFSLPIPLPPHLIATIPRRVRKYNAPSAIAGDAIAGSPRSFSATRSNLSPSRTTTTRPFSAVQ